MQEISVADKPNESEYENRFLFSIISNSLRAMVAPLSDYGREIK